MGHRGPDQIDSAREYFFHDRDRRNRVRHTGVMFSHFPTLPPYVLRYGLMRTTQQSQSVRQTHSETMRGEGGGWVGVRVHLRKAQLCRDTHEADYYPPSQHLYRSIAVRSSKEKTCS